ncbi:hypothetical protein WHR41_05095 [Cladosporium halotolerans]|uniref:RGS domain-containing protein n=1 Tax=Cladosporium halotolerans TaxID=1052096 RepID=A0AB34KLJ9_9PEZI
MVYSLTYRRPSHVTSSGDSINGDQKPESYTSGSSGNSAGIPEALSFDNIINNGTCPPCTVRDFMNYLKYIEHAAENLQFFLWYHDYTARFNNLKESERALSPEWTQAQADAEALSAVQQQRSKAANVEAHSILQGTTFASNNASKINEKGDPFHTPPASSFDEQRAVASEYGSSTGDDTLVSSATARGIASQAFGDAGMKWQPFTTQPYRDEISRIITVYIADNSPRELNLSSREKQALLHALQNTTHPSAFRDVVSTVEYSLRRQAHPNFIRWAICNGNRPRVVFARGLGVFTIAAGLLADLLITLSSAHRAWRVLPFLGWFIGIATLIAAWKGMCVVLHGLHHRHLRPWELFADSTDEATLVGSEKAASNDSLASSGANSFEDEPWVPRYKKRNVIRKIFDRQVWIQEPALRQIQDTIFLQSLLGAAVLSAIFVGIFCAVPKGNLF